MMKYLPYGTKPGYVTKVKKCCGEHPVITGLVIVLAVAALAFSIYMVVRLAKKAEGMLDDEWNFDEDDDEPLYFYPNEDDFEEGE